MFINLIYLRKKEDSDLLPEVTHELEKAGFPKKEDAFVLKVISLLKDRVTFIREFALHGKYFFQAPVEFDTEMHKSKWNENCPAWMNQIADTFENLQEWNHPAMDAAFKGWAAAAGIGAGKVLPAFRLAITGMAFGPSTFDVAELIGKQDTLARLRYAAQNL